MFLRIDSWINLNNTFFYVIMVWFILWHQFHMHLSLVGMLFTIVIFLSFLIKDR